MFGDPIILDWLLWDWLLIPLIKTHPIHPIYKWNSKCFWCIAICAFRRWYLSIRVGKRPTKCVFNYKYRTGQACFCIYKLSLNLSKTNYMILKNIIVPDACMNINGTVIERFCFTKFGKLMINKIGSSILNILKENCPSAFQSSIVPVLYWSWRRY